MKILAGLGYTQKVSATPPQPWRAVDALLAAGFDVLTRECEQNADANGMQPSDIAACSAFLVYSWSFQTIKDKMSYLKPAPPLKLGVVCLGVQIFIDKGQAIAPFPNVEKLVVLQIDEAFPTSGDVKGAPWVDITDPDALSKIVNAGPAVNVSCRSLWGALANPVQMHTESENHDAVIALILGLFRYYVGTAA